MKDAASTLPGREEEQKGGRKRGRRTRALRQSTRTQWPSMAAPLPPRPHTSAGAPPSLHSAVPVLDPPSLNLDKIDRTRRISRDTQPQLLVGHAWSTDELLVGHVGSTDELLVGVHPTDPLKMAPSPLNSVRFLLPARTGTATASMRQLYCVEKQYRVMKQASRCARRPAIALIVALTEHRGRFDTACRPPVNAWLRTIGQGLCDLKRAHRGGVHDHVPSNL